MPDSTQTAQGTSSSSSSSSQAPSPPQLSEFGELFAHVATLGAQTSIIDSFLTAQHQAMTDIHVDRVATTDILLNRLSYLEQDNPQLSRAHRRHNNMSRAIAAERLWQTAQARFEAMEEQTTWSALVAEAIHAASAQAPQPMPKPKAAPPKGHSKGKPRGRGRGRGQLTPATAYALASQASSSTDLIAMAPHLPQSYMPPHCSHCRPNWIGWHCRHCGRTHTHRPSLARQALQHQ